MIRDLLTFYEQQRTVIVAGPYSMTASQWLDAVDVICDELYAVLDIGTPRSYGVET